MELGDSKTSETNKLETSSSAPVYLDMKRSSNKVTVWVRGQDAKRNSVSVTFVNEYADPQITGGDNQRGATNGRLADPLEVTVRDSKGRAIPGGVVVGFASTATGSMFIPVSGTTVYISGTDALVTDAPPTTPDALTTIATSSTPSPAESIFVKTDSSGKAKTYFQLGSETQQRVTITLPGTGATYDNTFFRATAASVASTDAATIAISDGNGQSAGIDEALDDPLIVIVKDAGGRIVAEAPVTFTTNSGTLSPPESGDPGDPNTTVTGQGGRYRVVDTDGTGRASVRYNVGDLPGGKQVFASIVVGGGRTREVTFGINGGSSSRTTISKTSSKTSSNNEQQPSS